MTACEVRDHALASVGAGDQALTEAAKRRA